MAQGMCAGCDVVGSLKSIEAHISGCSRYAERFAAGEELRSPTEEFRARTAERVVSAAPRAPRKAAPKVSEPAATVAAPAKPKSTPRRPAPVLPERFPGDVNVEFWDVPQSL